MAQIPLEFTRYSTDTFFPFKQKKISPISVNPTQEPLPSTSSDPIDVEIPNPIPTSNPSIFSQKAAKLEDDLAMDLVIEPNFSEQGFISTMMTTLAPYKDKFFYSKLHILLPLIISFGTSLLNYLRYTKERSKLILTSLISMALALILLIFDIFDLSISEERSLELRESISFFFSGKTKEENYGDLQLQILKEFPLAPPQTVWKEFIYRAKFMHAPLILSIIRKDKITPEEFKIISSFVKNSKPFFLRYVFNMDNFEFEEFYKRYTTEQQLQLREIPLSVEMIPRFFWYIVAFTFSIFSGRYISINSLINVVNSMSTCAVDLSSGLRFILTKIFNIEVDDDPVLHKISVYTDSLNAAMRRPAWEYSHDHTLLAKYDRLLKEVENFMKIPTNHKYSSYISHFRTIYSAASAKLAEIQSSVFSVKHKQEPRVLVLFGKAATGKTFAMQEIAHRIGNQNFNNVDPEFRVIQIANTDNYWPALSGQPIAIFDESAATKELTDDLLWKNMRAICSTGALNLEGAAIQHKHQPCPFKFILTTTNSDPTEITNSLSLFHHFSAVPAIWSRCIVYECIRNEADFGPIDFNNRSSGRVDPQNYSHIIFKPWQWDTTYDKMVPTGETHSFDQVVQRCNTTIDEQKTIFDSYLNKYIPQADFKTQPQYLTINLNGKPRTGKTTFLLNQLIPTIKRYSNLPVYQPASLDNLLARNFRFPHIFILDDLLLQSGDVFMGESDLMNWLNTRIPNNSVVIFCSNISKRKSWFPNFLYKNICIFGYPFPYYTIKFPFTLPFSNPGMARRLGYNGYINGETLKDGIELYFDHVGPTYNSKYINMEDLLLIFKQKYNLMKEKLKEVEIERLEIVPNERWSLEINVKSFEVIAGKRLSELAHLLGKEVKVTPSLINAIGSAEHKMDLSFPKDFCVQSVKDFVGYINFLVTPYYPNLSVLFKINNIPQMYLLNGRVFLSMPEDPVQIVFDGELIHVLQGAVFFCLTPMQIVRSELEKPQTLDLESSQLQLLHKLINNNTFYQNSATKPLLEEAKSKIYNEDRKNELKALYVAISNFVKSPIGIFFSIFIVIYTTYKFYHWFTSESESSFDYQAKKRTKRKERVLSDDEEDDIVRYNRMKAAGQLGERKERPPAVLSLQAKNRKKPKENIQSDDEDDIAVYNKMKKAGRLGVYKERPLPVTLSNQMAKNTPSLAGYSHFSKLIAPAFERATQNLCKLLVYASDMGDEAAYRSNFIAGVYGLQSEHKVISVAHIINIAKTTSGFIYYLSDQSNELMYKIGNIQRFHDRDMAIYYLPAKAPRVRSLTSQLPSRGDAFKYTNLNFVSMRYDQDNREEFFNGNMKYMPTNHDMYIAGNLTKMNNIGIGNYGSAIAQYFNQGDCGMPYFCTDNTKPNLVGKIIGIHCLGNSSPTTFAQTVCSLIFKEDLEELTYQAHERFYDTDVCPFMHKDETYSKINEQREKELGFPCYLVINKEHDAEPFESFIHELEYVNIHPGLILEKNFGKTSRGSVPHSHLQVLEPDDLPDYPTPTWKWTIKNAKELQMKNLPANSTVRTTTRKFASKEKLIKFLRTLKNVEEYSMQIQIRTENGKVTFILNLEITKEKPISPNLIFQAKAVECPLEFPTGAYAIDTAYVTSEEGKILCNAFLNLYHRNVPHDLPLFEDDECDLVGSFRTNQSPVPKNDYFQTPYSSLIEHIIPIDKFPFQPDTKLLTPQERSKLVLNNFGIPCQRATQVQKLVAPRKLEVSSVVLDIVRTEYLNKIYDTYSDLNLLDDKEVLRGYRPGHDLYGYLGPLETDSSVGWTLKKLFGVTKKSDLLFVDESGAYHWLDNPASEYLQKRFSNLKETSKEGKYFVSIFTDLLKMEKLKPEKVGVGRVFCAEDFLGILFQRYVFGNMIAKGIKYDKPIIGVGTKPSDFHRYYQDLVNYPYHFAADFKGWDKRVPRVLFAILRDSLKQVNPHIENEIDVAFHSLMNAVHVSGHTLYVSHRGMPSGCFVTAPFNCLLVDLAVFICFVHLKMEMFGETASWIEYDSNIYRLVYGDDLDIAVTEDYKWFNRHTLTPAMLNLLGIEMDTAEKDGKGEEFDELDKMSWISRYFRKLGDFPIYVGALKKHSITPYFHWVKSLSHEQMGSQLQEAQRHASLWEPEFFLRVQQAIKVIINEYPEIRPFVEILPQDAFHLDFFHSFNLQEGFIPQNGIFPAIENFNSNYMNVMSTSVDYVSLLNLLSQQQLFPVYYTYINVSEGIYRCQCDYRSFAAISEPRIGKKACKQEAARLVYLQAINSPIKLD